MFDIAPESLALLLAIALLVVGPRCISRMRHRRDVSQLLREIRRHMPVFSAETTRGREAEFIRDSLPKRLPFVVVLVAVVLAGVTLWLMTR